MKTELTWQVGFSADKAVEPAQWMPAEVPGAVQLDYMKAHGLPDYKQGGNIEEYLPLQDYYWTYKTMIDLRETGEKYTFLTALGIDYEYDIFINGRHVLYYEGLYKKQIIDLKEWRGSVIEVRILIYPCPKSDLPGTRAGTRDEANQSVKPAVSYGWDFHPRLVPLGIWQDIYLVVSDYPCLPEPDYNYTLSADRKTANLHLSGGLDCSVWSLFDPSGKLISEQRGAAADIYIENVELWWCSGYGKPNLYKWRLVTGNTVNEGKIGFKTVSLVKGEGTWRELHSYPMTRNTPPITLCLNGKTVFAKGINWVAPEIFYGAAKKEQIEKLLDLVKKANFNYVRSWGGAIVNKEFFFDYCDENGILVWQEFPLACNRYYGSVKYLNVLKSEATAIIKRVRRHAALMLWCGGNELFNNWSGMTDQSHALRLLGALTYEYTPEIPFLPTAPVMGMAHGPYSFLCKPDDSEVIKVIAQSHCTAYTEMGIPSYSCADTLRLIDGDLSRFADKNDPVCVLHNMEHLDLSILTRYFGEGLDIGTMIEKSQYLQQIGLQMIYEEARRQKPYCSMVSAWCFNEPWPCVENNSLVSYPFEIKPAYYSVAAACRPVLASARAEKLCWNAGEMLELELFLLNDLPQAVADGSIKAYMEIAGKREFLLEWQYKNVPVSENVTGPVLRYKLPKVENTESFKIILEAGEYSSEYTLLYAIPPERKRYAELNVLDEI